MTVHTLARPPRVRDERSFLLQRAQPAMTGLIDDTVLHTFAVVGRPDRVGPEIHRRFGDIVDRYTLYTPYPLPEQARLRIVASLHHASGTAGPPAEADASPTDDMSCLHPQET